MKYPIDVEEYIEAMRTEHGPDEAVEQTQQAAIPLVNEAYTDGLAAAIIDRTELMGCLTWAFAF